MHGEEEDDEAEAATIFAWLGEVSDDGDAAAKLRLGHGHGEEKERGREDGE